MLLINSKKLIITITLVITTLGAIYAYQKAPVYKSTALIEIGKYYQDQAEQILIEPTKTLIQELTFNFIHKQQLSVSINSIKEVDKLIKITFTSPSSVKNKKILNEIVRYIENRHSLLLLSNIQKTENQFTYKIESIDYQINYANSLLESEKLRISNQIENLNIVLPRLDKKIELLIEIIDADTGNLLFIKSNPELFIQRAAQAPTLDQVIFTYKERLIDYENEKITLLSQKDNLIIQLKLLESNDPESEKVFRLSQEKDSLELELEFLMQQNPTSTQLIGEIVTTPFDSRKELIIFLSFIFGLFLCIITVFIITFLKTFKEKYF